MGRIACIVLSALLAVCLPEFARCQQTIILRDGSQFQGRLMGADDRSVSFQDREGGMHRIEKERIDEIRFDHGDRLAADNGSRGYTQTPYRDNVVLPAGTAISVRTNESINTQDATESRTYSAQVSQDVVDAAGNVLVPRGSDAQLIVRRIGQGNLVLDLQSISVNGRRYLVDASDVAAGSPQEGVGANKRTGEFAGGGALLGTLLGAVAGGGKGAAIGALAGGTAGVGAEVLTRGTVVRVPAESLLNFRLDRTMSLRPERDR